MADLATGIERRSFLLAVAIAATGSVVGACAGEKPSPPVAEPQATDARRAVPLGFALGSSVLWATDADLSRTLDAAAAAGASMLRFDVSWTFAQPCRRRFDWTASDRVVDAALERRLQILATITNTPAWAAAGGIRHTGHPADPGKFGEFAAAVAAHYRGRITNYELWNEPNGRMFFQPGVDPVAYTAMVRSAYPTMKSIDPAATVLAGALGAVGHGDGVMTPLDFLRRMYAEGAHGNFDALSFHPYDYRAPLAVGAVYETAPMQQMVAMHDLMARNGDADKLIWITEYGAPSTEVDETKQAELIIESLRQWPEVSYAGPFFVHTVRDEDSSSSHPEDRFGVMTDAYLPKLAFTQLKAIVAEHNPPRDEYASFSGQPDPALGAAVTPVFELPGGHGQQFENGFRFQTADGFFNAPTDVGRLAVRLQVVPSGQFADGHQDFQAGQVRVFSSAQTGTHAVLGAILHAWQPELGFPISDEFVPPSPISPDQRAIDFEHGSISWAPSTGAQVVVR